jgi:hypothetical protein
MTVAIRRDGVHVWTPSNLRGTRVAGIRQQPLDGPQQVSGDVVFRQKAVDIDFHCLILKLRRRLPGEESYFRDGRDLALIGSV